METSTIYVVQYWVTKYEYWHTTCEASTGNMFELPVSSYETEEQGRARLAQLREASPSTTYRLAKITQTVEVI